MLALRGKLPFATGAGVSRFTCGSGRGGDNNLKPTERCPPAREGRSGSEPRGEAMFALRRKPPFAGSLSGPVRALGAAPRFPASFFVLAAAGTWRERARHRREIAAARRFPAAEPSLPALARPIAGGTATFLTLAAAGLTLGLWALNPITTRIATAQLSGLTVGIFRPVGAGILCLPLLALLRLRPPRDRSGWILLLLSAGGGFIGFPLLFSMGTARTSASHVALIMAAMGLFTGLIGSAVERRAPPLQWRAGAAVALAGEAMLITLRTGHAAGHVGASVLGDILVLGGCLAASASFVAGARLTTKIGTWAATFWAIALAGMALAPIAAIIAGRGEWAALSPIGWAALLHLALGSGLLAWIAWFWALARGGVTRVAVLQLAQPVASLILTVLLLSERLTAPLIVAAIAILAGVAFARRGESNGNAAQSVPAE